MDRRHCRRTTGHDRVQQLSRFDDFIKTFIEIKDAKTKELLIGPKTKLKIEATRLSIASGFYIDPIGINMFRDLGRDRLGRTRYACYRGTNALEVDIKIPIHLYPYYTTFTTHQSLNFLLICNRVIIGISEIYSDDTDAVQSLHTIS